LGGKFNLYAVVLFISVLTIFLAANASGASEAQDEFVPAPAFTKVPDFFVPAPPFSEDIFPCTECHADLEVNETRRELDFHEDIVLNHAEGQRWCLDCHNPNNRDKLRLVNGQLIFFEKSYLLCGQCHGTIYRDWKAGIHGKRTGYWNGRKQYRLCVNCHNPHQPKFKPLKPLPPPVRPEDTKHVKSADVEIPENPLNILLEAEHNDDKEKE
jgi:hypothetical protein